MDKYLPTISFRLINSELLESGYVSSMTFSQDGGQIGSSAQCQWQIQDNQNSVAPVQCTILWKDKHFALRPIQNQFMSIMRLYLFILMRYGLLMVTRSKLVSLNCLLM